MPKRVPASQSGEPDRADRPARALRILVVENHADTRQGIDAFLKALGHRAAFVADKAGALARVRRATFDVLLSDISLPDGTGWELLQTLDAQGRRPPHAIAMSGLGDPAHQTRSHEAGFELHLVKPFRPQDLEDALRRAAKAPGRSDKKSGGQVPKPRVTQARLRQRLHDGLAQQLAAAALLQGVLTNRLEALSAPESGIDPAVGLKGAVAEARRVDHLLEEALAEVLSLMRSA